MLGNIFVGVLEHGVQNRVGQGGIAEGVVGSKPFWRQPSAVIPNYESVPTGALDT